MSHSYANKQNNFTFVAGDDMNGAGYQYHAVALDDGKVSANPTESIGILISKPKSGEHGSMVISGISKFAENLGYFKLYCQLGSKNIS